MGIKLFICSPLEGHLVGSQFSALRNKDPVNIHIQVLVQPHVFISLWSAVAGLYGRVCSTLKKLPGSGKTSFPQDGDTGTGFISLP